MSLSFVIPEMNIGGNGTEVPTLQFWKKGFVLGGGKIEPTWRDIILHGNTALTLVNSKADSLEYLKLFGGTEQLPETYLDTVTLSGGCEQRNLPSGFTQVEYLGSDSQAYIDTGIAGGEDTLTIECKFMYNTFVAYGAIYGNYVSDSHSGIRCILANSENRIITNNNTICTITGNTELNCAISQIHTIISKHDTVIFDGVATSIQNTATGKENANNFALFNRSITNPNTLRDIGLRVYGFKIYNADVLVSNLIPCRRNSDSVLGMYDTISGNFLTNAGTGTFTAGADVTAPSPDNPIDIVCNNGAIKYETYGLPAGYTQLTYLQGDGTAYIQAPVEPTDNTGMKIVFEYGSTGGSGAICGTFNGAAPRKDTFFVSTNSGTVDNTWAFIAQAGSTLISTNSETPVAGKTYTALINYKNSRTFGFEGFTQQSIGTNGVLANKVLLFARLNIANNNITASNCKIKYVEFTEGTTVTHIYIPARFNNTLGLCDKITGAFLTNTNTSGTFTAGTAIQPYIYTQGTIEQVTDSLGNTASAERLLAVGDYKDTQEVISGGVTRNVGIKVFDGTENWQSNTTSKFYLIDNIMKAQDKSPTLCSHYKSILVASTAAVGNGQIALFVGGGARLVVGDNNYTTVTGFKQYLASQYAQGTPVIVVYPKSSATTESVQGQSLSKSPVTQTAGAISGLTITTTESAHTVPTPQQPLPINCNNGVLKVSRNLYDSEQEFVSGYINDSGNLVSLISLKTTVGYIKVSPNTTYTISYFANETSVSNMNVSFWTNNNTFIKRELRQDIKEIGAHSSSFTTTATTAKLRVTIWSDDTIYTNFQIEQGSASTPYTPYSPTGIYTDGTVETVEVHSKNLFDVDNNLLAGYYINNTTGFLAQSSDGSSSCFKDFLPSKPNITYTMSRLSVGIGTSLRMWAYDKDKNPISSVFNSALGAKKVTGTTPNDTAYIRCSFGSIPQYSQDIQLEQGSTATTYEPYYNGGTATAENLLKVGTYQDVQSVIDGGVTRNVGIKVLDGTENWDNLDGYFNILKTDIGSSSTVLPRNSLDILCTHYKVQSSLTGNSFINVGGSYINFKDTTIPSLAAWKAYLANQYQAGTPVIIVYPLATPTTETVTGQPLTIQEGTNIVEITQASMDNLELEVKYKAGVAVTITEIENAQLDDNVEVTING